MSEYQSQASFCQNEIHKLNFVSGSEPCAFDKALEVIIRQYKRKVIAGGKQELAVVLFNTEQKKNSSRFEGNSVSLMPP